MCSSNDFFWCPATSERHGCAAAISVSSKTRSYTALVLLASSTSWFWCFSFCPFPAAPTWVSTSGEGNGTDGRIQVWTQPVDSATLSYQRSKKLTKSKPFLLKIQMMPCGTWGSEAATDTVGYLGNMHNWSKNMEQSGRDVSSWEETVKQHQVKGKAAHPGFLDLSQFSSASLLKAAVATMLLLFSWMLAMVSECMTTSISPVLSPVERQP